jgi:hypothetical protein
MRRSLGLAKFNYPKEFVTLPEYTEHAGQVVEVIRKLTAREADPPNEENGLEQMFFIRAADDWTGHAFESELEFC